MARPRNQIPTYREHKQSGQAIVTITQGNARRDILLGKYATPESKVEYERVLAQLRTPAGLLGLMQSQSPGKADRTLAELLLTYVTHANQHYRLPDGEPTSEIFEVRIVASGSLLFVGLFNNS